jgi:NADP-dependent 3-hydroxy acid dehydrogenase YdfG
MDIQNKVVIITGASEGIGEAAAKLLASKGAKVVLAARSLDKLQAVAQEITAAGGEAIAVQTDMRDESAVKHLIAQAQETFGHVDILVNNAGQSVGGPVAALNLESFRQVIDLNVFGVLYATQAVVPLMRANADGGLIVNISSMVSKMTIPNLAGYASTKYMLNGLMLTAREELAKDNIRVLMVYPRMTATKFAQNGINYSGFGGPRPAPTVDPAAPARPPVGGGQPIDSAEHVANRILDAIQNEPAEQYMV